MPQSILADLVDGVEIRISPIKAQTEPPIIVFDVEITDNRSKPRRDAFGTESELRAYLRGLEAGGMMIGKQVVRRPPIPRTD